MKKRFTLLLFTFAFFSLAFGQDRYVQEVFTDEEIVVHENVHYATNATILGLLFDPNIDEFVPEPLMMDVYEPDQSIDTDFTARPVVIVVHGGDALPQGVNGACWGDKRDSVTVTTARKLARMGYVAIAPNYRLGWNPLTMAQDAFLDGLVDAAVRIQQDLRACARYLRKDESEGDNTYNIHPDQFTIWGTASSAGTYSGFASYINEVEELQTPTYFVTDAMGNVYNTFNEAEAGNIEGTVVGMTSGGDTTNYINTPGYSSAFQISALGAAISLDPGIVDEGEPAMIMFGNPISPVTQFDEGPIQLPTTQEVVAFVQLSQGLVKEANTVGVNDAWVNANFIDQYSVAQAADPNFGAQEGWLPLYGDFDNEYPWVHWDEVNCPQSDNSFEILPGANRDYALSQIDTMAGYFGARACVTFNLGCSGITNTKEPILEDDIVSLSPNPTTGNFQVQATNGQMIEELVVFSIEGRVVANQQVNSPTYETNGLNLAAGFYTVVIRFEDGIVAKKLMVN